MATELRRIPSPADRPTMTARALIAKVKRGGGHVYRMREHAVFVITDDEELARWLLREGGSPYLPAGARMSSEMHGSYRDAKGGRPKWDIYVHTIPVLGEQSIWEAAKVADADLHEVA